MESLIIDNPQELQFAEDCLKSTKHIFESVWINVCNGSSYIVPNGFWDYFPKFLAVGILLFGILIILLGVGVGMYIEFKR